MKQIHIFHSSGLAIKIMGIEQNLYVCDATKTPIEQTDWLKIPEISVMSGEAV